MLLPPTEVLLKWPSPNYENPKTRGSALLVVNLICISLVVIIVGLRLYTRLVIKRWFGVDDVFILLALLFTITLTVVVLLANQSYGWDRHVWDIPFNKLATASKIAMVAKLSFTAAATFTRLSLHCLYYRLVSDSNKRWFKWLIHANVIYTVGIFISFIFIGIFQCFPVENYWIVGAPANTCMDEAVATLVCGIISCIADFVTTITPMPLVMGLHLPRRQRFAVAFLFGLGIIVTAAGIVRTWFIYRSLFNEYDLTWYSYPLWIAAAIEIDLGVVCASAPVLRPLLAKVSFSLSDTLSHGTSLKKSSKLPTQNSSTLVSNNPPQATSSSKRRSEAIQGAPELLYDQGKSYELKHWDDVERQIMEDDVESGSQEGILHEEDANSQKQGISRMWSKMRKGGGKANMTEDMTITKTSEIELEIDTVSQYNSRQVTRQLQQRDTDDLIQVAPVGFQSVR